MMVVFIGGGNMGRALVGGLLAQGKPPGELSVVEVDAAARSQLEAFGIGTAAPKAKLDVTGGNILIDSPSVSKTHGAQYLYQPPPAGAMVYVSSLLLPLHAVPAGGKVRLQTSPM